MLSEVIEEGIVVLIVFLWGAFIGAVCLGALLLRLLTRRRPVVGADLAFGGAIFGASRAIGSGPDPAAAIAEAERIIREAQRRS